jgi:hypothetical protein
MTLDTPNCSRAYDADEDDTPSIPHRSEDGARDVLGRVASDNDRDHDHDEDRVGAGGASP